MDYVAVNNQHYYVDQAGKRIPIDETCVSMLGTGGLARTILGEDIDLVYTDLKLAKDHCREAFMTTPFDSQQNEYDVLKKDYGIDLEEIKQLDEKRSVQ